MDNQIIVNKSFFDPTLTFKTFSKNFTDSDLIVSFEDNFNQDTFKKENIKFNQHKNKFQLITYAYFHAVYTKINSGTIYIEYPCDNIRHFKGTHMNLKETFTSWLSTSTKAYNMGIVRLCVYDIADKEKPKECQRPSEGQKDCEFEAIRDYFERYTHEYLKKIQIYADDVSTKNSKKYINMFQLIKLYCTKYNKLTKDLDFLSNELDKKTRLGEQLHDYMDRISIYIYIIQLLQKRNYVNKDLCDKILNLREDIKLDIIQEDAISITYKYMFEDIKNIYIYLPSSSDDLPKKNGKGGLEVINRYKVKKRVNSFISLLKQMESFWYNKLHFIFLQSIKIRD